MSNPASRQDSFFFVFTLVLLAIVFAGFAPSFYLRFAFEDAITILPRLYLHGAILSGWFLLLAAQAWLIRRHNPALHRKLGYVGAFYGLLIVAGGLIAALGQVSHDLSQGVTFDTTISAADPSLGNSITYLAFISHEVWISITDLSTFALLLGAGVVFRRQSDVHKRLMLLATLVIVVPALGRISRLELMGGEGGNFVTYATMALLAAIILHDLLTLKKMHIATFLAIVTAVLLHMAGALVANTGFGMGFVRALA